MTVSKKLSYDDLANEVEAYVAKHVRVPDEVGCTDSYLGSMLGSVVTALREAAAGEHCGASSATTLSGEECYHAMYPLATAPFAVVNRDLFHGQANLLNDLLARKTSSSLLRAEATTMDLLVRTFSRGFDLNGDDGDFIERTRSGLRAVLAILPYPNRPNLTTIVEKLRPILYYPPNSDYGEYDSRVAETVSALFDAEPTP